MTATTLTAFFVSVALLMDVTVLTCRLFRLHVRRYVSSIECLKGTQLRYTDSASIIRLIDRDANLDRAAKERQKASIHEVLRYCENKTDCRRSQVLSFFSETFDPAKCNGGCDVCLHKHKNVYTSEDVTEDAVQMIKMVESFDREDRITRKNTADCFRGTNGGSGKGLSSNEYFGSGKHWKVSEAERLVAALVINGGLDEFNIVNTAGYSNSYIKVGLCSSPETMCGRCH